MSCPTAPFLRSDHNRLDGLRQGLVSRREFLSPAANASATRSQIERLDPNDLDAGQTRTPKHRLLFGEQSPRRVTRSSSNLSSIQARPDQRSDVQSVTEVVVPMHVFMSHSRRNGGAALKLCEKLEVRGARLGLICARSTPMQIGIAASPRPFAERRASYS